MYFICKDMVNVLIKANCQAKMAELRPPHQKTIVIRVKRKQFNYWNAFYI